MQTKIVATQRNVEAGDPGSVSRRRFIAGTTAAATSALVAAETSTAAPTAGAPTPALARLFDQWQTACREGRRLNTSDDEARDIYFRTAPAIPNAIVAPTDDEGRLQRGFGQVYYAQRSRKSGREGGTFVLRPTYWLDIGDEDRAHIAS